MLFSQRKGYTSSSKILQRESIDDDLRNSLWSLVCGYILDRHSHRHGRIAGSNLEGLFVVFWYSFLKEPIDTIPWHISDGRSQLREHFFNFEWYEIYDFIEFIAKHMPDSLDQSEFLSACNAALERENSAYRFVSEQIVEITSDEEINEIEEALDSSSHLSGVEAHLESALEHLSDRETPDYRNSIKESISAVEAVCIQISGDPKATLGQALRVLEERGAIHGALKRSFSALYGYTSDADGIRHAMLEESNLSFTDAKYMLVACTSFINYLLGKVADLGLEIDSNSQEEAT